MPGIGNPARGGQRPKFEYLTDGGTLDVRRVTFFEDVLDGLGEVDAAVTRTVCHSFEDFCVEAGARVVEE